MSKLTTHVLDVANGRPASGMRIRLSRGSNLIVEALTNADGRCDEPLLSSAEMEAGNYELRFMLRDYYESIGTACPFLNEVPIAFSIEEGESYHVPLLCSPWSYSTYRGS